LETDANVLYGATPTYDGTTPTKTASAQYTYAFNGWDKTIAAVTGDMTYTATYTETTNKYSITFKNGTTTITTVAVNYGEDVTYSGVTPTKEKDAQYSYIFNGWVDASNNSDDLTNVIADRMVYAHYKTTTNSYTITWKNEDGTTLKSDVLEYGTTPAYVGDRPAKAANATNVYVFDGWTSDIAPVTKDATYTAKYQTETNHFTYELSSDGGFHVSQDKDEDVASTMTSAVIPDTYDDGVNGVKDVTAVDDFVIDGGAALTSLTIGANVESISSYSFLGLTNLSSLSIGNKINSIDSMAFQGSSLETAFTSGSDDVGYLTSDDGSVKYAVFAKSDITSVSLDEKTVTIKDSLFQGNTSLTKATLDDNLTIISDSLFNGCSALVSVTVGSKIVSINPNAFTLTALLTNSSDDLLYLSPESDAESFYLIASKETIETATVKKGTKLIASGAFYNDASLTAVTLNDDLSIIGGSAFAHCSKLTSIAIPTSVTDISDFCFDSCTLLSSINIPSSIKKINYATFNECTSLTSITLPSSLEKIDTKAFSGSGLTSIDIPNSIKVFSSTALQECQSLTSITMSGDNAYYQVTGNCVIEKDSDTLISGCVNSSIPTDGSVTILGDSAFYGLTGLTTISIPSSIAVISTNCFFNCSNLESVSLVSGLETIDKYAFEYCTKLSSIVLPTSLTTIGESVFKDCLALSSIVIPTSVITMGSSIVWSSPAKTTVYCLASSKPDGWDSKWNNGTVATYWYSETSNTEGSYWHYVDDVPTVWIA
jgi:hypothetical protein